MLEESSSLGLVRVPDNYFMRTPDESVTLYCLSNSPWKVSYFKLSVPFGEIKFDATLHDDESGWIVSKIMHYLPNTEEGTLIEISHPQYKLFSSLVSQSLKDYGVSLGYKAGKVTVEFTGSLKP